MGFKVITDGSGSYDNYPDDGDGYSIDSGVLTVDRTDDERIIYSPVAWLRVEEKRSKHEPVIDHFVQG